MNRTEQRLFFILSTIVWIYLGLRAWYVPVVHDEAATFLHYLQVDQFIPFFAMWDANNHVLNSMLAYFSVNTFGVHTFWLRLPNLLFFPVYAYFGYTLSKKLHNNFVKWLCLLALISASLLIEFFALARGYGISMALLLGAITSTIGYFEHNRLSRQLIVWILLALGLLANMSLMPTAGLMWLIIGVYLFRSRPNKFISHITVWALIGGIVLLAGAAYALKMKVLGLLYTGALDGFVAVTALSIARFQFGIVNWWFAAFLTLIGGISSLYLLMYWFRQRFRFDTGFVIGLLLLFNGIGSVVLATVFGVNYPDERTALYFLPLFILAISFAVDRAATKRIELKWLSIPLLYFPFQLGFTANLYTSQLWDYLHVDREIHDMAAIIQSKSAEPLRISGGRMHELSWAFDNIAFGGNLQLMERPFFPDTTADLIIARDDMDFSEWRADTLYYNPKSGFALLEPSGSSSIKGPIDTLSAPRKYRGSDTYFNLAEWAVDSNNLECGLLRLRLSGESGKFPMHVQLVIAAENAAGKTMSYDAVPLFWIRKKWNGEHYDILRYYQFPSGASRAIVYLWNIGGHPVEIDCSAVIRQTAEKFVDHKN